MLFNAVWAHTTSSMVTVIRETSNCLPVPCIQFAKFLERLGAVEAFQKLRCGANSQDCTQQVTPNYIRYWTRCHRF